MCRSGIVSRCLPGTGSSCVWARAQQVWGSRRLVQDVHAVPHRPPSRPRVRPCAAAFHLSGSVWSGAQHFLGVTEFPQFPRKQTSVLQGEEAGVGALSEGPEPPTGTRSA